MGVGGSRPVGNVLKQCTLYKVDRSPACRSVMMTLDAINLSVNEVDVDVDKGEHRTPEMLLMNPFQTLPILKDGHFVLRDSHAISTYLASRYAATDRLLPQEPGPRSRVEQFLHYDSGVLYPRFRAAASPILYENCRYVMPQHISEIEGAYSDLESALRGRRWLTSDWPQLADITLVATVSTLDIVVPVDKTRYPRLSEWLARMSEEQYYVTANKKGLQDFARRIDYSLISETKELKCPTPRTSKRRRSVAGVAGAGSGDVEVDKGLLSDEMTPIIKEEASKN